MLYKLEIKSRYLKYYGNEQFEQKEDFTHSWLTKDIAERDYNYHLRRPNAVSVKLYKLSWLGYKLIKEYDRDKRSAKEHNRVDINTLLRDADRRSARGL